MKVVSGRRRRREGTRGALNTRFAATIMMITGAGMKSHIRRTKSVSISAHPTNEIGQYIASLIENRFPETLLICFIRGSFITRWSDIPPLNPRRQTLNPRRQTLGAFRYCQNGGTKSQSRVYFERDSRWRKEVAFRTFVTVIWGGGGRAVVDPFPVFFPKIWTV